MADDFEPTETELAAIGRAVRRLSGHGRDDDAMWVVARTALRVLVAATVQPEAVDPPIAASLPMPTWNQPSGVFTTVVDRPLLDLLEVP